MNEPTDEQVKEFWEWCGFTILLEDHCLYPEDRGISGRVKLLPPIDLNNIFKYAVPKLLGYSLFSQGGKHVSMAVPLKPIGDLDFGLCQDGETPALALFWAIWEVIRKTNQS